MKNDSTKKPAASSPLYTSPAVKLAKAGTKKDLDGAYRAFNRLEDQKKAA